MCGFWQNSLSQKCNMLSETTISQVKLSGRRSFGIRGKTSSNSATLLSDSSQTDSSQTDNSQTALRSLKFYAENYILKTIAAQILRSCTRFNSKVDFYSA